MLYTKKIEEITYQDVVDFCNGQIRENINLDYKESISESLAKTIAAMANTWGGLIIIGVEDNDSKPKLPVKGIKLEEHLLEQINNIILNNITPPVFPEIQICPSDDNKTALIVIRISQSNMTPHAIRGNTKVYIRTNTSNEPEELATIDRILWLINRREKSIELKNQFFNKSQMRLQKLLNRNIPIEYGDFIMSASPLYPYEIMIDYRKLIEDNFLKQMMVQKSNYYFPSNINNVCFKPIQSGSYSLQHTQSDSIYYEEINCYGFFYHRQNMTLIKNTDEIKTPQYLCPLRTILIYLDLFLESMEKFYSSLGYWGFIEIKINLNNISNVDFEDLSIPGDYSPNITRPVDNDLSIIKEVLRKDLSEKRRELVTDIFSELAWNIGFPQIDKKKIEKLFEKGW